MKKNGARDILIFLVVVALLISFATMLWETEKPAEPTYAEVVRAFESEQVKEYVIDGGLLKMKLQDGSVKFAQISAWI